MKHVIHMLCLAALGMGAAVPVAAAQATGTSDFRVHDRRQGELSPDTTAPSREALMRAIDSSSPSQLATLLEYGERVECHECVPLLQRRMLDPREDPTVRELAAWWLRRRPFGMGAIMRSTRMVLESDPDPARRAAAADAIGEFMDPHGIEHLGRALSSDTDVRVRVAAVRGLARINAASGLPWLSMALRDASPEVVDAALSSVLRVNFFRDHEALLQLLGHEQGAIRRRAALVIGSMRVAEAVPALSAMVTGDVDVMARQAAAWALGRIGTPEARAALAEARGAERERRVLDAIEVALRM